MSALTSRRKVLLSTAALLGALTGYGQGANAACVGPANNIVCSGGAAMNPNQLTINDDNAVVSTLPGFEVVTADTAAISMTGDGALFFVDTNNSTITGGTRGLDLVNPGDIGGVLGSITVGVNSTITANQLGLNARLNANGHGAINIAITGDGSVTSLDATNTSSAISANSLAGTDVIITTGEDTELSGGQFGIEARSGNDATGESEPI